MTDAEKPMRRGGGGEPGLDALFSGILMLLAAVLLLAANLYTTDLWQLKVILALLLIALGSGFCWKFVRARRRASSS